LCLSVFNDRGQIKISPHFFRPANMDLLPNVCVERPCRLFFEAGDFGHVSWRGGGAGPGESLLPRLEVPAAHQPCQIVGRPDEEKKQLAKDFESVLLTKLFDQVKDSIGGWGLEEEEGGASEQVHGLFWLYLAQDVADKGGFGLWQDVYRHFQDMDAASAAGESIDREM